MWLKRIDYEGPSRSHTELWERQLETRQELGQRLKDQGEAMPVRQKGDAGFSRVL